MATIESYETAAGKRYRVRYRKPDHSQTTKRGFRTKREAEVFLAVVETKKADGTYIDPTTARVTIQRLGAEWLAGQTHLKPSSTAVIESAWRLHVAPAWGSKAVGEVRFSEYRRGSPILCAEPTGVRRSRPLRCFERTASSQAFSTPRYATTESLPILPGVSLYRARSAASTVTWRTRSCIGWQRRAGSTRP